MVERSALSHGEALVEPLTAPSSTAPRPGVLSREETGVNLPRIQWEAVDDQGEVVVRAQTKDEAILFAAEYALNAGYPVSVKIHLESGEFEEERTYPRSADPEESEG